MKITPLHGCLIGLGIGIIISVAIISIFFPPECVHAYSDDVDLCNMSVIFAICIAISVPASLSAFTFMMFGIFAIGLKH